MIAVTTLTGYLYCKRKLFLQKVLGLFEEAREAPIKGRIKHDVFDSINRAEPQIVKGIMGKKPYEEIEGLYVNRFSHILRDNIIRNKAEFTKFNIPLADFFKKNWPLFEEEAKERAYNLYRFMQKHELFGDELWLNLTPKIESEFSIKSENLDLIGKIDRLKIFDDSVVPFELKSGKSPGSGAWKEHKLQLAAYMMMLKDNSKNADKGIIKYVDERKEITVNFDSFLEDEIKSLLNEVKQMMNSRHLPDRVENQNKCKSCGLRKECFDDSFMQKRMAEKISHI